MDNSSRDIPFTYLLRVRYYECDAQQVVFNARYGDYVDTAATEFFRALFGDYRNLLAAGMDTQVVRQLIEWQAPARFDDVVAIQVTMERVGHTSFQLNFALSRYGSDELLARCEMVYVLVDAQAFTKMAIPDDVRSKLESGAPGVTTDHAGARHARG